MLNWKKKKLARKATVMCIQRLKIMQCIVNKKKMTQEKPHRTVFHANFRCLGGSAKKNMNIVRTMRSMCMIVTNYCLITLVQSDNDSMILSFIWNSTIREQLAIPAARITSSYFDV